MNKYPLKLSPALKDAIWGGTRLCGLSRNADMPRVAEAWSLSDRADGACVVQNGGHSGKTLNFALRDMGYAAELPPLVKLIDAAQPLSVQVHPDDAYARAKGLPRGKTEMWYVLDCEPGAYIYVGLNRAITRDELRTRALDGTITEVLQRFDVKRGDAFYIPGGTLHALGGSIFVAEVQQSSDTTYRVFDYGRTGADGIPRDLHLGDAVACAALTPYAAGTEITRSGATVSASFGAFGVRITRETKVTDGSGSTAIVALDGECGVRGGDWSITLERGECAFVPDGFNAEVSGGEYACITIDKWK